MYYSEIIQILKDRGCRITNQRKIILDIVIKEECSSCKEIYYKASKVDPKIGFATVYRMINMLEEIGAISRKNMYKIEGKEVDVNQVYIKLDNGETLTFTPQQMDEIISIGLRTKGHIENEKVCAVGVN